jgi:hypothetical protein
MGIPLELETVIENVTVFRRAALVARTAWLPDLGESRDAELRIRNLPLTLDDASVRVTVIDSSGWSEAKGKDRVVSKRIRITGLSGWAVRNMRIEVDSPPDDRNESREMISDSLYQAIMELEAAISSAQWQKSEVKRWLKLPPPAARREPGERRGLFPFDAWGEFLRTCERQLEGLDSKELDLIPRIRKVREELDREEKLGLELNEQSRPSRHQLCKDLFVTIAQLGESQEKPAMLEISYITPGAQWLPVYKLYMQKDYKKVRLVLGAQVAQKSGEDWQGVRIQFSSATLERVTQLPELPSRRLGRAQPPHPASFRPKEPPDSGLFRAFDDWMAREGQEFPSTHPPFDMRYMQCLSRLRGILDGGPALDKGAIRKIWLSGPSDVPLLPSLDMPSIEFSAPPPPPVPKPAPASEPVAKKMSFSKSDEALVMPGKQKTATRGGTDGFTEGVELEDRTPLKEQRPSVSEPQPVMRRRVISEAVPMGGMMPARAEVEAEPMQSPDTMTGHLMREAGAPRDYLDYEIEGMEEVARAHRGMLRRAMNIPLSRRLSMHEEEVRADIDSSLSEADVSLFPDEDMPGYQCIFEAQGRAHVPGDGFPHRIDIMTGEAASSVHYRTVPRVEQKVFGRLMIKNPFTHPLPQGQVQVFIDNAFILSTPLQGAGGEGQAYLPLGVEPRIRVSRNLSFHQDEKGLGGANSIATHDIEIRVRSHMPEPVNVEVLERIPIRDENEKKLEIKVQSEEPKSEMPEFTDGSRIRGVHRWNARLEAGEDLPFKIKYQISIPSRLEVLGGNRRG